MSKNNNGDKAKNNNHANPEKQDDQKPLLIILLLFCIIGAGLLISHVSDPAHSLLTKIGMTNAPSNSQNISAYSPRAESLVNRHLTVTNQEIQLQQQRMQIDNNFYAPQLGDSIWPKANQNKKNFGVDHSADKNEDTAYHDLNRYPHQITANDPDHIIQQQLSDDRTQQEYEKTYREAYARQFIENAKAHGYEVEVDENLVVKKVKPIRTPSQDQFQLQTPGSTSAR